MDISDGISYLRTSTQFLISTLSNRVTKSIQLFNLKLLRANKEIYNLRSTLHMVHFFGTEDQFIWEKNIKDPKTLKIKRTRSQHSYRE